MYGMNAAAMAFDGKNKYIRITDIDDETRTFLPAPLTSPNGDIESKFKLQNGDIVFARTGASVGKSYLYNQKDGNVFFAGFLVKFSVSKSHPYFVFSQTLTGNYDSWVKVMSMRSGQPGINAEEYKEFKFFVPRIEEQTKIANFLTAIDEKITQLTQKYDLLVQYKKGVMQQIFSQKLRFKDDDGREFPEWEETILGKVADSAVRWSLTGGPFGSNLKAEDYTDNGIRIIQLQNIGDGTFNDGYKIYTSENKANELLSCNIYPNEIIISKMGDPVARCCIMPSSHDRYLMASDGIRLVVDRSLFNTKYIHDFINYETFRKNALEASTGSTRRRIGLDELKKLPIVYPCLTEQTKIANFLTAIDDKITHTKTQLDAVKLYKKGLLQQLFV